MSISEVQPTFDRRSKVRLPKPVGLIEQAKYKAALSVNSELLSLYWKIGTDIIKKQKEQDWGTQVVPHFPFLQVSLAELKEGDKDFVQVPLAQIICSPAPLNCIYMHKQDFD